MKNLVISIRVFAFLMFLFVPSILVLLFAGFVLRDSFWFGFLGLATLIANGAAIFFGPARILVSRKLSAIAGTPARR